MNTLTVAQIFSNFQFYQENYLSIISNPTEYHTPVDSAYISVWPLGDTQLHLGDLLQLWFSEKWLINSPIQLLLQNTVRGQKKPFQRDQDLYLYQLAGSALSGTNTSKVWSRSEQKTLAVSLNSVFQYVCEFKGTTRPIIPKDVLVQELKKAI